MPPDGCDQERLGQPEVFAMKRRKGMTAEELMAQLQMDPGYVQRQAERADARELREAEVASATRPLRERLAEQGYEVSRLDQLVPEYGPLAPEVVRTLLEWLPTSEDLAVQEQIVRALAASSSQFPGEKLAKLFDETGSETFRWAIANTIAEARPDGITDWALERLQQPSTGKAREMLTLAVARLAPPEVANPILLGLLDDLTGHVAMALAESGGPEEAAALERLSSGTDGWVKQEIVKAVHSIRRRSGRR